MSSKFLILIFMILVSVQLPCSLGWLLWQTEAPEPPLFTDTPIFPAPMNSDKSSEDSLVQTTLANIENVKTSTSSSDRYEKWSLWDNIGEKSEEVAPEKGAKEEFTSSSDEYTEEEFTKSPKSEKETQSIPSTSTSSSDKIVVYVSTVSTSNTDSSTPTTEESESGSSTTTISTTSTTTESSLDVTVANNVYRSVDEGSPDSDGTLIEKSSPSSTDDNVNNENSGTNNSTEFTFPNVTYSENPKKANSSIDEENENMESEKTIERKDKETYASREVPDVNNQNSGVNNSKESTVNDDAGSSTPITESSPTDMAITPAATENTLNSTYVNRDVNSDTENYDNSSKSEIVSDLDQSSSIQANATIKTILSTSTDTVNTTEMAGSMSNGTTPEVNFGSFVNSGSTSNAFSQLIFNLCILIFSISVIV